MVLSGCTGGAGQKGGAGKGFEAIQGDLWNAAQDEVKMDMPESHESGDKGQMAQDGLAGASPEDQTTFPSNVEDQVIPYTSRISRFFLSSCTDWLISVELPSAWPFQLRGQDGLVGSSPED